MKKGIILADFGCLSDANAKKLEAEGYIVIEKAPGREVSIMVYPVFDEKESE